MAGSGRLHLGIGKNFSIPLVCTIFALRLVNSYTDMQGKKFISPGNWFSMVYPASWSEFEDSEGTFLFYNPDVWTGNFRISAFKGASGYGDDAVRRELKENPSATQVQAGAWLCAYSKETFCEQGKYYVAHLWVTGKGDVAFECSFTVPKGESPREGEAVVASLEVRHEGQPYPPEVIPLRLSEMYAIDEHCNRLASLLKKELKKEFQGEEEDLPALQQLLENGGLNLSKRADLEMLGVALCAVFANEVEGAEWKTLVDGRREAPVLQYRGNTIDPLTLCPADGKPCNVEEIYRNLAGE